MSNEDRIRTLLTATPAQLAAFDAALSGNPSPAEKPSLRLIRMGQAAAETGMSRQTIWRMIKDGRIRAVETRAGMFRIPEVELLKLIGGGAA